MQGCKKQGLSEVDNCLIWDQKKSLRSGIPKDLVLQSKLELDHLSCSICQQVIWKAVACSQSNCYANYCQVCIDRRDQHEQGGIECPKCNKPFKKTSIPLVNNVLSAMRLKCAYYQSGCQETVPYDSFLKHLLVCDYQKICCTGCHLTFFKKEIESHQQQCEAIIVECTKCGLKMTQLQLRQQHGKTECLESHLKTKTDRVKQLQTEVDGLRRRLGSCEMIIQRIVKGETIPLRVEFYSSFPFNFHLHGNEARLIKASWNQQKQKFDFLHFYLTASIKTDSPVGFHWRIVVSALRGNLLIGICSSLSTNSVDFVINRFGEIKKKEATENKYKLIRKSCLTFGEGDAISFKYQPIRKVLRIENQSRKLQARLQASEIGQLGENLYSFYSLDTINDCIRFI